MEEILNRMEEGKALPNIQKQKIPSKEKLLLPLEHENVLNKLLSEIKPIDFYEKADLLPGERLSKQNVVVIAIDSILDIAKKNNWGLTVIGEQVNIYNGAFWKTLDKNEIRHFLRQAVTQLGYDKLKGKYHQFVEDLMKQFLVSSFVPKKAKESNEILINFKNGTLVINETGQYLFKDFDAEDYLFYQLDFDFNPNVTTSLFDVFLNRVLIDEADRMILAEFTGYVFIRNSTLKLEKSLILYGNGANGKSTFFEILHALLGRENISNYSLQALTNESGYQRAQIHNKLLNYASDISSKMDSAVFKLLTSGEPVEARLPYGNPFIMENYARLIFNANELPRDVEQNTAFFRRFLILCFDQTIPENERDPEMAKRIIATELPAIFNWVIHGMQRLIFQKGFTYSAKAEKAIEEYRKQSDSVAMFMYESDYTPGFSYKKPLKELYGDYRDYCNESGNRSVSNTKFSDRLRKLDFNVFRGTYGYMVEFK
jgi:putative DNA primase/helicase